MTCLMWPFCDAGFLLIVLIIFLTEILKVLPQTLVWIAKYAKSIRPSLLCSLRLFNLVGIKFVKACSMRLRLLILLFRRYSSIPTQGFLFLRQLISLWTGTYAPDVNENLLNRPSLESPIPQTWFTLKAILQLRGGHCTTVAKFGVTARCIKFVKVNNFMGSSGSERVAGCRILIGLLEQGFQDFLRVGSFDKIAKTVLPYVPERRSIRLNCTPVWTLFSPVRMCSCDFFTWLFCKRGSSFCVLGAYTVWFTYLQSALTL